MVRVPRPPAPSQVPVRLCEENVLLRKASSELCGFEEREDEGTRQHFPRQIINPPGPTMTLATVWGDGPKLGSGIG